MTASEYLKDIAGQNTVGLAGGSFIALPFMIYIQGTPPVVIAVTFGLAATWIMGLWFAWWSLWRAEMHSAIESIHLTEGTAQMQRRIIEQRNEIEKLKRK